MCGVHLALFDKSLLDEILVKFWNLNNNDFAIVLIIKFEFNLNIFVLSFL